tara:strand:+ start:387 stop:998 length:612 start_codon:yes stop_codon:yes gene_type:complete
METLSNDSYDSKQTVIRLGEELMNARTKLETESEYNSEERRKLLALLRVSRSLLLEKTTTDVLSLAERQMKKLLSCDKCNVYLKDEESNELVSKNSESGLEVRIGMNKGVIGHVLKTGKTINLSHQLDSMGAGAGGELFNGSGLDLGDGGDIEFGSSYKTTSLLCVPIWEAVKSNNNSFELKSGEVSERGSSERASMKTRDSR